MPAIVCLFGPGIQRI